MSNPVITRLGTSQFWYKHWYSNKSYTHNLHQDKSFEVLIKFYLDHGLTFPNNPNVHEYWYRPNLKKNRTENHQTNLRFYRRFFYTNDRLSIEHSYFIRHFSGEYFPLRLWIFKYLGWVILCVQWFKPIKKKMKRVRTLVRYGNRRSSSLHEYGRPEHPFTRLKVLLFMFTKRVLSWGKTYRF